MKSINYSNLSEIKDSFQKYLKGEKVYDKMISFYAIEFKKYIHSWILNNDISWEEFSVKNSLLSNQEFCDHFNTEILDKVAESFYYKEYDAQSVFLMLKDINKLEKEIKNLEKNKTLLKMKKVA